MPNYNINLMYRHGATRDHCTFKKLNKYGKCEALCSKNVGNIDCAGVPHETMEEYQARVLSERKGN
jgi:hypothetical protein